MPDRKVTLGCTGRGTHRWTTLHVIRYTGDVQPGEHVRYTPVLQGSRMEVTCPRCRKETWLGHETGGEELRDAEMRTRTEGHVRVDVSLLPF